MVFGGIAVGGVLLMTKMNTCTDKIIECYSYLRMKYVQMVNSTKSDQPEMAKVVDLKLIVKTDDVLLIHHVPEEHYTDILISHWNHDYLKPFSENELVLLHIEYEYQDQTYRLVINKNKNQCTKVLKDLAWVTTGFHNEFENITTNINLPSTYIKEICQKYAGPLGDFYYSQNINQDPIGFLDLELKQPIFQSDNHLIIEDVLGNEISFLAIDV